MATFKATVMKNKMRADKTWKVFIRLIHNKKVRYIPTEMYITKNQLTTSFKIKDAHILAICDEFILEYRRKINSLALNLYTYNIDGIVAYLVKKNTNSNILSFSSYFEEWKNKHKNLKGIKNYVAAFNSFTSFIGRKEIAVNDVNVRNLQAFVDSLTDKPRAASLYSSAITHIFNDMRDEYNDEDTDTILIKHSLRKFTPPKQTPAKQRGLNATIIRKIFSLPYISETDNVHSLCVRDLALDCFKLSFCLMGINAVDMYNATEFDGEYITYYRTKTKDRRADKAKMVVRVHPLIRKIFERFKGEKQVFSFSERYSSIISFERAINIGLKQIGSEVGVEQLQFYAARHSVATIAYNEVGIPMSVVDEMLCHKGTDMQITKLYIKKDYTHINDANSKLLEWMFGNNGI